MRQLGTALVCWVVTSLLLCWGSFDHGLAVYLAFMYSLFPLVPALLASSAFANQGAPSWQIKGLCGAATSCLIVALFLVTTGQIEFMFQAAIPLALFALAGFFIGATASENTQRNDEHPPGR